MRAALDGTAEVQERASKSQIGFWRRGEFAAVWCPGDHLGGDRAPLVLTVFRRERIASDRWKEVVEAAPGRFTHHLELREPGEVDAEVRGWLLDAWREAC